MAIEDLKARLHDPEDLRRTLGLIALVCLAAMGVLALLSLGSAEKFRARAHRHHIPSTPQTFESLPMLQEDWDRG